MRTGRQPAGPVQPVGGTVGGHPTGSSAARATRGTDEPTTGPVAARYRSPADAPPAGGWLPRPGETGPMGRATRPAASTCGGRCRPDGLQAGSVSPNERTQSGWILITSRENPALGG